MKKIVLVIFTVFFIHITNAQEKTLQLSLKEAIDYALKNSYNTKIAKTLETFFVSKVSGCIFALKL